MKRLIKLSLALLISFTSIAQDVIFKKDKSEIKSKIIEITDDLIKYKKWELQDGPLYNIRKSEVFMIIYANGQREIMEEKVVSTPVVAAPLVDKPIDTVVDYKNKKINHSISRAYSSFKSPLNIGIDQEFRIVKNFLNLNSLIEYTSGEGFFNTAFGLHISAYLPLNRLLQNYKNQDKGLFVFGQAGYTVNNLTVDNSFGKETYSSGGFSWRVGLDYMFTKGIGVTAFTSGAKSFRGGIVFSF